MVKMTLAVKFNDLHFKCQPRVSQDACLVIPAQICDELLCGQGKVYRRTDEWTDAGNENTPSAWKAKG